ncbi:hypothetical protein PCANC_21404 [Puccinia coronata f. sp. avenae]|uniref:Uncharacterized protein n=1 Tax=Puccinia coronata f. sp. avenae TaxID=200324 RepID=A0A2N5SEJ0_9BASI|nr:hypothetical protein PCANC_26955 [Puccinia coronata f. sp. avenae]PLW41017.1 hypothetical protein PCANC_21404 [Puccinia coronata f. sp. avenae]
MPDNICPMSFYSLNRLFDYFESVAKQASSDLLRRTCSEIFAEHANDLLGKDLKNRRLACWQNSPLVTPHTIYIASPDQKLRANQHIHLANPSYGHQNHKPLKNSI